MTLIAKYQMYAGGSNLKCEVSADFMTRWSQIWQIIRLHASLMKSGVKSALGYPILGSKRQDSGRQYRHQSYSHQGSSYSEDLRGFFSNRAPNYEDNNASHPYLARKLVAMLDVCQGEKVLDVATGTGYVALELARKLGSQGLIVGVDISKPMLQQVRRWFEKLTSVLT